ncbi:MAG: hypothetical protein MJ130_08940 [Lachnospiraceae bacterium]|nr:hypothetical protein [Lachnospiraceae bacterium]
MMVNNIKEKKMNTFLLIIGIISVALVNIKSIFCDYGVDNAYALATSYRYLQGDRLFGEMNEPHMISSFLLNIVLKVFSFFSSDYVGVTIFCQCIGVILYGIAGYFLYLKIRNTVSKRFLIIIITLFLVIRAKHTVFPEFSNMMIIFSVLLWITLTEYLKDESKIYWLVIASLCTALLVLSYQTTLLVFVSTIVASLFFVKRKVRFLLGYMMPCFISGMLYLMIIGFRIGFSNLLPNILFVFSSDSAHNDGFFNMSNLLRFDLAYGLTFLYIVLMVVTLLFVVKMSYEFRKMYVLGIVISLATFLSVVAVTNLSFNASFSYLILGVIVALMAINHINNKNVIINSLVLTFAAAMIIQRGIVVMGYEEGTIFECDNYVRVGPNKGIVTSIENCNRLKYSYEDWNTYVDEDDTVLAVGGWIIDSSVYLNKRIQVSHYSVMCNPTYNEKLEEYWTKYPRKHPNIIAVSGYRGTKEIGDDTWIMKYIDEYYTLEDIGEYWLFYHKK